MRFYLIKQLKSRRRLTYNLFLRLMGFVYFCAFFSVISQVEGLYGEHGILPVSQFLENVRSANGDLAWLDCPTLLWIDPTAHGLSTFAIAGSAIGLIMMAGVWPALCSVALFILYLSIVSVGQVFLSYQWDMLLLQAGFLTIIVSLLQYTPASKRLLPLATFLIFWLDLRLMFSSGICKLASSDPVWADLTALTYHFFTQPLPTPPAIFANAMPLPLSKFVCGATLIIEILVPLLILWPRVFRFTAVFLLALLQIMIALTGNYCFFNLLSIVLLVPLLDDDFLRHLVNLWRGQISLSPRAAARKAFRPANEKVNARGPVRPGKMALVGRTLAIPMLAICTLNFLMNLPVIHTRLLQFAPMAMMFERAFSQEFGIESNYGLFAVMTQERPEIIVEGSDDGINYKTYAFKYKVSRTDQAPPIVAPLQPRLDWQMWFEGLNSTANSGIRFDPDRGLNPSPNDWFIKFMRHLLAGDKDVLSLMADNPFPDKPPRFIRARVFNYYMVSPLELCTTGKWWKAKELGTYYDSKDSNP